MDLKNTANAARLLYDGMVKGKTDFAKIPFVPQKTAALTEDTEPAFRRSSPAREGLDTKKTLALLHALSIAPEANIHSVLLLAHGKQIFSASAEGYSVRMPHATFSLCKTVTGLAIGMLRDEGKLSLDDKVYRFFPEYSTLLLSKKTRSLTVRHLLTMSSGVVFAEAGAVVEENWVKSFMESGFRFAPGEGFAYNSMNSYMLAAIVTRVTHTSLMEYLEPRLFAPLGIGNAFWEKCPRGIEKGGWGLYLSAESMAKLGQLLLNRGVYNGYRIVSEEWVTEATAVQNRTPASLGTPYHYGYHLWVKEDGDFLLNGMFGQNTLVSPKSQTVLTLTAGDDCIFQDAASLSLAASLLSELGGKRRLFSSPFLMGHLRRAERSFGRRYAWLSPVSDGHEAEKEAYFRARGIFAEHHVSANNTGVLPFLIRLIQNNHSKGLSFLTLEKTGHASLSLTLEEGESVYTVPLGAHRYTDSILDVGGELYRVRGAYEWGYDEHRAPALKISLIFPELASSRMLLFRMQSGALTVSLFEKPGFSFIEKLVRSGGDTLVKEGGVVSFLLDRIDLERLMFRAGTVFAPKLRLSRREESASISNTLYPALPEFEHEDVGFEEDAEEESTPKEGFWSRLFGRGRKEK